MERLIGMIGLEEVAEQATQGTSSFESMNSFMSIFMIIIGVFVMYSAITGKGPAYKNDYPAAIQEDFKNMLRKFCWIVGPIALASGILDYLGYTWAFWISTATVLPAIVVFMIIFRRKFKKYL